MKTIKIFFSLIICFIFYISNNNFAQQELESKKKEPIVIIKKYEGIYRPKYKKTKQKMIPVIDPFIIQNENEYNNFINSLPKKGIGKGKSPDNQDPLLKKPKIDFKKYRMLVFINPDLIDYENIKIISMSDKKGVLTVLFSLPRRDPEQMVTWARGTGVYLAVIIPKTKSSVIFKKVELKK